MEWLASLFGVVGGLYSAWRFFKLKTEKPAPSKEPSLQTIQPHLSEVDALVRRFVEVYQAHGVSRTQIPRFLGEKGGLTLADVSTDEKLLNALSEELLQATCDRFGVQREWLDGKDVPIYPYMWHNDNLSSYIDFLIGLKESGAAIQGFAIKQPKDELKKRISEHGHYDQFFISLLFRVKLEHWGDNSQESIWKYYPLGDQIYWGYERTRMQLKAKVLIADMLGIYFKGCVMEEDEIEGLMYGRIFPGPMMEDRSHVGWYPEDYIFTKHESRAVADGPEALLVRDWNLVNGWRTKLENLVGAIEDNAPFKDGKGNPRWHERIDRMVY